MNKNIWIFNHYVRIPEMGGGTRHYDIASELKSRDYTVTIFTSNFLHRENSYLYKNINKYFIKTIENIAFVWINTCPSYTSNGVNRVLNMYSYYHKMMQVYKDFEKPDIIIGSSVHPFALLAAYKISKKLKIPFICEIRDLWPQSLIEMSNLSLLNPLVLLFKKIEKTAYKRSKKIVTLLPFAFEHIMKYRIKKEKIVYIPNGVNISRFDRLKNKKYEIDELGEVKTILDILNDNFCCTYTGSHGIANSLEIMLYAAKEIGKVNNKIKFIFIGGGTYKEELISLSKKIDNNNIYFFKHQPKNFIPLILSKSKVNLISVKNLPLYKYGISMNKIFDYLSASRPVLFCGNVRNDIIKESSCGISIHPDDYRSFADAVLSFYNMSEKERSEMGSRGRKYVENLHDIKILVDKYEKIINE